MPVVVLSPWKGANTRGGGVTSAGEHPGRKGGWRDAVSSLVVVTPSGAQDPIDVPHGLPCLLQT